jgi:hypothetical protein
LLTLIVNILDVDCWSEIISLAEKENDVEAHGLTEGLEELSSLLSKDKYEKVIAVYPSIQSFIAKKLLEGSTIREASESWTAEIDPFTQLHKQNRKKLQFLCFDAVLLAEKEDIPEQLQFMRMLDGVKAVAYEHPLEFFIAHYYVTQSKQLTDIVLFVEAISLPLMPLLDLKLNLQDIVNRFRNDLLDNKYNQEENELLLLQLHQVQEELESYYLELQQVQEELESYHLQNKELQKRNRALGAENKILKNYIENIYNSRTYRLTKPLRLLGKIARRSQDSEFCRQLKIIKDSELFDEKWYADQYPDVMKGGMDPATHYLRHGGVEGRSPSPSFDGEWYLEQYPDVAQNGINPLVHYLNYGKEEGRKCSPKQPTGPE